MLDRARLQMTNPEYTSNRSVFIVSPSALACSALLDTYLYVLRRLNVMYVRGVEILVFSPF